MVSNVQICVIPHKDQRYDTIGDWVYTPPDEGKKGGILFIFVSDTGNWQVNMGIAAHEFTEATLCIDRGITQKEVDAWDISLLKAGHLGEPGEVRGAPYLEEHRAANDVENTYAAAMMGYERYHKLLEIYDRNSAQD